MENMDFLTFLVGFWSHFLALHLLKGVFLGNLKKWQKLTFLKGIWPPLGLRRLRTRTQRFSKIGVRRTYAYAIFIFTWRTVLVIFLQFTSPASAPTLHLQLHLWSEKLCRRARLSDFTQAGELAGRQHRHGAASEVRRRSRGT